MAVLAQRVGLTVKMSRKKLPVVLGLFAASKVMPTSRAMAHQWKVMKRDA